MPDGQPAPVSHQHADDTTLHVLQPSDAQAAPNSSITLFARPPAASSMSASLVVFWFKHSLSPQPQWLPSPASASSQANKPSSILEFSWATRATRAGSLSSTVHRHLSCHQRQGLSFLSRVHVAKQVLAASLWYQASFQRPSEQLLKQLSQQLRKIAASVQQANHSGDAVALAQGCSQGSAHLPSSGPGVALFPGERTPQVTDAAGPTADLACTRDCLAELACALGPSKA